MPGMYPYGVATFGEAPIASGDPIEVFGTRYVAEVLAEWNRFSLKNTRTVVEVLAAGFSDDDGQGSLDVFESRLAVEVIGNTTSFLGMHAEVGRIALEVIASDDTAVKGLLFGVAYTESTWATVLDAENWASGGQFHFHLDGNSRLRVYGTGTAGNILLTDGVASVSATFTVPSGPFVLSVRSGATPANASFRLNGVPLSVSASGIDWDPVTVDQLNGQAPASHLHSGQLAELMLWDRTLSDPETTYIESYLTCRWITPGCNPYTDLGPAP